MTVAHVALEHLSTRRVRVVRARTFVAFVAWAVLVGAAACGPAQAGYINLDRGDAVIAHAFFPPPNGNSAAGDIHFSADFNWVDDATDSIIDDDYDLQTVALHELGHALGLDHSSEPGSIMQPFYSGGQRTLGVDDVDCIRSLYGGGGGACDGGNAVASWDDPAELTLSVMPENSVVEDGAGLAFDFADLIAGDELAHVTAALNTWISATVSGLNYGGVVADDGSPFNAASGAFGNIRLAAVGFAVPEPAGVFLMGFGILAMLTCRGPVDSDE